jgi:hypothetical protein
VNRVLSNTNGLVTTMEIDGDKTNISKSQDVEPLLDYNKAKSNETGKKIYSDAYNHVASIPPSIQVKWLFEEGLDIYNPDHAERLRRKLNSNEYMYLRTSELIL